MHALWNQTAQIAAKNEKMLIWKTFRIIFLNVYECILGHSIILNMGTVILSIVRLEALGLARIYNDRQMDCCRAPGPTVPLYTMLLYQVLLLLLVKCKWNIVLAYKERYLYVA